MADLQQNYFTPPNDDRAAWDISQELRVSKLTNAPPIEHGRDCVIPAFMSAKIAQHPWNGPRLMLLGGQRRVTLAQKHIEAITSDAFIAASWQEAPSL